MITNSISALRSNILSYNLSGSKTNGIKSGNNDFKDLFDIQKNNYISDGYSNYTKDIFMKHINGASSRLSIKDRFTEIDSEFPDCREFTTYLDKVNGNGKYLLDVRIENCPKGTFIDDKEFEYAMSKVIITTEKTEYAFAQMGHRETGSWFVELDYDKTTGKINVTDFIKDAPNLINTIADEIYGNLLRGGNTSKEDLARIKANLDRIKKEMYDFFMELAESDEIADSNYSNKYSSI